MQILLHNSKNYTSTGFNRLEHLTVNQRVLGSSPRGGAKIESQLKVGFFLYMTYYIYILYSNGIDRYYVGYSQNPWIRFEQHLLKSSNNKKLILYKSIFRGAFFYSSTSISSNMNFNNIIDVRSIVWREHFLLHFPNPFQILTCQLYLLPTKCCI